MDNEIFQYVIQRDVNPLSFRERRMPQLPLIRMSQTVGIIIVLMFFMVSNGFSMGGLRQTLIQMVFVTMPILWLFDIKNGTIRIERFVYLALFFGRMVLQRNKQIDVEKTDVIAINNDQTESIAWYVDDRMVTF